MLDTGSRHGGLLDQGRSRDPTMMEWNLGTDHSLQDMLDCDITDEIDDAIGGHPELNFDVNSITPLGLDDYGSHSDLTYNWFGPQSLLNGNSDSSNSNYSNYKIDLSGLDAASIMVNPKSMVPHVSSSKSDTNANTTSKRHFPFALKFEPEDEKNDEEIEVKVESVDLDEADEAESEGEAEAEADAEGDYENELSEYESEDEEHIQNGRGLNVNLAQHNGKSKTTLLLPSSSIKTLSPQMQGLKAQQQSVKVNGITGIRLQNIKILPSSPGQMQQFRRQIYSNNNVQGHVLAGQQPTQQTQLGQVATSHTAQHKRDKDSLDPLEFDDKLYPKPAYSYSCLIAMALKNSQTGSLPVSEIYNFMCEHFPYFKTAPNGWKNSVRHNLSLNKCFEKIDKPAGSSNQRKGCLWAINPAKVAKMDEEVQKWSRKDPLAIKKAMIYPDHLELLERGEMKYIGGGSGSGGELSSDETESSADEVEGPGMSPAAHQSHTTSRHLAANSVTDSYDESSQDCDVDVAEQLYESIRTSPYDEIDIDEDNKDALRVQLNISSTNDTHDYQINSNSKRQKTLTGTVQANYVYQPVSAARRKTAPLFLTTTATPGSFLKIE